jgi:hexosaminidase
MLRSITVCLALTLCTSQLRGADAPATVPYRTFNGKSLSLHPWRGKKIVVLTARGDLDPAVMQKITDALDGTYNYYKQATGGEPARGADTTLDGLSTVAEVDHTCGAGCGSLGATGIELQTDYFQVLYHSVKDSGEFDQVIFYEFGRNFWLYQKQLGYVGKDATGTINTGYAVFMRFMAMRGIGVKGAPFRDRKFTEFEAEVQKLIDTYVADKSLDWSNTLLTDHAPANPMDLNATDLFASFLFRLYRDYGTEAYIEKLWHEVAKRPEARTTQDAVDNLVIAASRAAGHNLSRLFKDTWRWPVSAAALAELSQTEVNHANVSLIPAPKQLTMNDGSLRLNPHTHIVAADPSLAPLAHLLAEEIKTLTGLQPATVAGEGEAGDIVLRLDPALNGEVYRFDVGESGVVVNGANYDAVAAGTATLLQSLQVADGAVSLPRIHIADEPAYPFRAALIDLGRKYHTPSGIKQVVELCRLYKVRYLHLHLSDDQLFMFPSTHFPQAGKSNHEFARFEPASKPHVAPYTLDEMKDLETFTRDRGVHLVPELDLPGHSGRLIADARDPFGFPGNGSTVNIASPATLDATATLLNEVMDVFASTPYIHLGADEVGLGGLEKTPEFAQAAAKLGNIHSGHDLYCKFVADLCDIVKRRGKTPIVWEEAFNPGGAYPLPKEAVVMIWSLGRNPADATKAGYSVVNASWTPLYIVRDNRMTLDFLFDWDVAKFGREESKQFTPLADTRRLLGSELCSWENPESIEIQMLRERLALVAERSWNPNAGGDLADYRARLAHTDALLEKLVHPVSIKFEGTLADGEITYTDPITVTLSSDRPGATIRYTLDNNLPDEKWTNYTVPFKLDRTAHIRAGLFDAAGTQQGYLSGRWFKRVTVVPPNLAAHKPVTEGPGPARHDEWSAEQAVDGRADNPDHHWASTDPAPQWLQVDLQKVYPIDSINVITYWDGSRYYQLGVTGFPLRFQAAIGHGTASISLCGYNRAFSY